LTAYLGFSSALPESCLTPDHKLGKCILLEHCPSLNKMSNDFETPMTLERFNFLIGSQCKIQKGILTVCCSLDEFNNVQENILQKK